jgi:hypothetical protein
MELIKTKISNFNIIENPSPNVILEKQLLSVLNPLILKQQKKKVK